jgi:hypothetical protein
LAGIAVSPALAAATLTLGGATAFRLEASCPDAELLELGRQFDELQSKLELAFELSAPADGAYSEALQELGERLGNASSDEYTKELKKIGERINRDFPPPSPTWGEVSDMQAPITRKIMALPASTIAGLAVKARVAKSACDCDTSDEDCDWDTLMARKLIEAVLSAGGMS